ncbi:MAG: amidase [Acidimicrobiales bacterium]
MSDELARLDATAQAELVTRGEAKPVELVDAAIERIERFNPHLNAVIHTDPDRARAAALAVDPATGVFPGVPFLLKDLGANQAGWPYWQGNRTLRSIDHRSATDTEFGARFARAGLVTLGKTNTPEMGSTPTTQPRSCGPTANPWDPARSPAGSSGGSAAAGAAGLVPIAHANDGGGSTRLPAAWCGLVGLKPSRGRVAKPDETSRLVSELAVTRTVRDTARILDAVRGATAADLYRAPDPSRPYVEELGRPVEPLRVAMLTGADEPGGGPSPVDPACIAAVEHTAATLEAMGHRIEPVAPDVLLGPESAVNGRIWMASVARWVESLAPVVGRPLTAHDIEPYNWAAVERGRTLSAVEILEMIEAQHAWTRRVIDWMSGYDVLITPTAGLRPQLTVDLQPPDREPWRMGRRFGLIGRFTLPFNATGQPAISLPLYWTDEGLPIGVQFVGGMGAEDLLLRLAAALEEALPWAGRTPPVLNPGCR